MQARRKNNRKNSRMTIRLDLLKARVLPTFMVETALDFWA